MPKYATDNPRRLWRYINGKAWHGWSFQDSREENKALAKYLRSFGIPVRAITLPETNPLNYGMGAPERYVLYVPKDLESRHAIDLRIDKFFNRIDEFGLAYLAKLDSTE